MQKEIAKIYDPKQVEDKWYKIWLDRNYFHATVNKDKKPYTIVIPPPNVTDRLHMGHAFNNSLQDILIRYHKKKGYETLWLPGTDHAGIATQSVVERELAKENKSRYDLGRKAFVERVWQWKEKYGSTIVEQLKKLGCALDWQRERFTMDEGLSHAVQEVFIRLYKRGLIYKGLRIVNWDPASATALADDEVEHKEMQGKLYHIRYKFADSNEYLIVATTRPETLLGDTGIAVSPQDETKQHLIGRKVIIPFVNREVEIFADEYVDKEFGSGFVKVTPAHDPNDFEMGQRHHLKQVIMLDMDGKILSRCQQVSDEGEHSDELPIPEMLAGQDRFKARKIIVDELQKAGLLEKIDRHTHAVGHSYRSKVPVEPFLSVQWFVKMKPLAEQALKVVQDGKIHFHPRGRFEKTYEHWMTNIRDWCISRQLWWGHRIPAWYNETGEVKVSLQDPSTETEKWTQDPDVLDTWFSSQLWPFSTLGWPDSTEELEYFYPTDTLVTGPDIIFFWVARMIMAGLEFIGDIPFKHVYFNGIIRDDHGRKMSKSLGNGIDPLEMIEKYSADAVRFTIIKMSSEGNDINISNKSFEMGRNFSNKIWNAFRFLALNLEDKISTDISVFKENYTLEDRWIISRFNKTVNSVTARMDDYKIGDALDEIYHFFWHEYCDWYLEMIKKRLYQAQREDEKKTALTIASFIMKGSMELLHPFIPFITEEIWQYFEEDGESVLLSPWPQADARLFDEQAEEALSLLQEAISGIRNLRAEMDVPPAKKVHLFVAADEAKAAIITANAEHFAALCKVENIRPADGSFDRSDAGTVVVGNMELFIPMTDLIDLDKERERLQKELQRLEGLEKAILGKLNNNNFVEKAPAPVVQKERDKLENIRQNLEKVRKNYEKFN